MVDVRTMAHGKPLQIAVSPETAYRCEVVYVLLDTGEMMQAVVTPDGYNEWCFLPALPEVGAAVKVARKVE